MNGSSRYEDMGILKIKLCSASQINKGQLPASTATVQSWSHQNRFVGEPIFVADPNGLDEDDGVLLVISREENRSTLVIIDAKSMFTVAEVIAPFTLMFEFHGRYFPPL